MALALPATPILAAATPRARPNLRRWLTIAVSLAAAAIAAGFYGINEYAAQSQALTEAADRNARRFEAVYRDAADARIASLRLGVDLVVANPEITGAFIRNDRPALANLVLPLFDGVLKPRYGTNQFNFWTPPATLYFRAIDPKEFGTDGAQARRSIVTANERRAPVSGMETGLGGRLGIRAIAPVMDGTRLVGVVELGDDLVALLRRARAATGVEFAAGLDRKRSDEVERLPDKAADSIQGTDVFFDYSSEETGRLVRTLAFNAREPAGALTYTTDRTVYVRPFIITNFAGAPTVVVATIFDLTQSIALARQSAIIRALTVFAILAAAAILGLLQFQKIQQGFARVVFGERKKLQETTLALETARQRLREVDLVKQGFFTNVVAAITEPLQAVHGQMQRARAALASTPEPGAAPEPDAISRLDFSITEIGRLAALIADYRKIELFRHDLVNDRQDAVALDAIVAAVLDAELARFKRLPQLRITTVIPTDLPRVRAAPAMLRHALAGLIGYGAENGGTDTIRVAAAVDDEGWVRLAITGTAFAGPTALDALLEDARQFIARLRGAVPPNAANGTLMALVLARTIAEHAGGRLETAPPNPADPTAGPGFVLLLPASS